MSVVDERVAAVMVSRAYRGIGGGTFRQVRVGDASMKLVRLFDAYEGAVEPMFLVETWDDNVRIPQVERSGKLGAWTCERDALFRAVEHVYEHSPVCSDAHRVAAGWLVATDWGRR